MKKSRFTEVQVLQALQKHESSVATGVICREMGIAPATFYKWKAKYGGLDVYDVQKLKNWKRSIRASKGCTLIWRWITSFCGTCSPKKAGPCHQKANSRQS
jgi:putative transposase